MISDNPENSGYASPPCFAHELDGNGYAATFKMNDIDIARWRSEKREELIAARLAVSASERKHVAEEVADVLNELIDFRLRPSVSLYWPFRCELNLRDWMRIAHERGAKISLPEVVAKAQPLVFREWTPECKMEKGVWNIPVPSGSAVVTPTVVISPLVGYDPSCFRLGYGGGFFDRTLAAMSPRPIVIGVGLPCSAIPTIHAQPHDIPMDFIVTGKDSVTERAR